MRNSLAFPLALAGLAAAAACTGKSTGTIAQGIQTCTSCHGSGDNSAPPASVAGATATTAPGVGAHQAHVNPGPFRKAVACSECHPVPLGSGQFPGNPHRNGADDVVFGPLASSGGATPTFNPATLTCSTTYCHGGTLGGGAAGGTNTTPIWNRVDGTQVACGTCHGIPPTDAGHPVVDTSIPGYTAPPDPGTPSTLAVCATCHPGTVRADGSLDIQGGQHIDGVTQTGAFACARCHGDVTRLSVSLAPAPPNDRSGNSATTFVGVGAHMAHLTGTTLSDAPVSCSECHAVPASMLAHPDPSGAVNITWGPLAAAGGTVPVWNRTTMSCAASYCHGSTLVGGTRTAPVWTQVDGTLQASCTSCHGDPPSTPAHTSAPNPSDCNACHTGYTSTSVVKALHIDGYVQIGGKTCTTCHGSSSKLDPNTGLPAPVALKAAPGGAGIDLSGETATTARGVGAHDKHLFGSSAPLRATPIACSECHVQETSTDHPSGRDPVTFDMMRWGPLATAGGSHPTFDAPPRSQGCPPGGCTCSTTYCHGSTLTGGTNTSPTWVGSFGAASILSCTSCHGDPPPAPHDQRSDCGTCHDGYSSTTVNLALHIDGKVDATGGSCTSCHGDPSRTPGAIAPAPPVVAAGTFTGDPGAHLKHLTGTLLRSAPIDCAECHAVPAGPPGPPGSGDTHGDRLATVVFGQLSRTGGTAPSFSPATLTCSTTYCHGATLAGGTETAPKWNETGGTASACGACHGVPPADTTHTPLAAGALCSTCHQGYGGAKGGALASFTVDATDHLNGVVDATGGSCTSCHGTAGRTILTGADPQTASAPPVVATTGTWPFGPGAHQNHLNKGTGAIGKHVACSECHAVPSGAPAGGGDTHGNGTADVAFPSGSLARKVLTLSNGNAGSPIAPVYAPGSGTTAPSCSTTYCHGEFTLNPKATGKLGNTIAWNAAGPLACSACHVMNGTTPAPNDSCHPPNFNHDGGNRCSDCHKDVSSTGTAITNATLHVNGAIDGKCIDCHAGAALGSSKNRICQ
jgi:predicted CxxxxCH...CXXCH cytochrome family protein